MIKKCQVFTPENYVRELLDSVKYIHLKELLGTKFEENYKVQSLESGEILEIASWIPNKKKFIKTYMKENWQIFEGSVWNKGGAIVENFI